MSERKWKPAPEVWSNAFDTALPAVSEAQPRKMFGYKCVFLNGNMVAGLHEAGLVIRLAEEDRKALIREGGQPFVPMPGRVMREYVVAPLPLADDPERLRRWLERAFDYVATLPVKAPKPATKTRRRRPR